MKGLRKGVALVVVNVGLFLLLLELAGVVVFYSREGRLFYRRSVPASPPVTEAQTATKLVLHPLFGFIRRPGLSVRDVVSQKRLELMAGPGTAPPWGALRANEFGFFSAHEYPYVAAEEVFLVGVFGGSLAQWFALQGEEVLAQRLRELPALAHRRVEVVNFAQGGFKQPQQLQVLSYFLVRGQRFDFVLNIDGFNEIALAAINVEDRVDPTLPASRQLLGLQTLLEGCSVGAEQLRSQAGAQHYEERQRELATRAQRARSGGQWLVLELLRRDAARRYRRAEDGLVASRQDSSPGLIHVNRWPEGRAREDPFTLSATVWKRASRLMDSMLGARRVPYLHVIQPNQYFSQRSFSDEERRRAVNPASPYASPVRAGYPALLTALQALRAGGTSAVSATDLFDRVPETVYADDCCHLNQRGNEILAHFIADQMVPLLAPSVRAGTDSHAPE